jgi:repressor LexA
VRISARADKRLETVRGARYSHEHVFAHRSAHQSREESMDLTKRQREIFDYISRYLTRHGYPPTVREIGKAVGLHSSSTVHAHLAKLESIGVLKRDPSKPRAIEVLVERAKRAIKPSGLPLVGHVAAGEPLLAEENIEDYMQIPSAIGDEDGDYILRVRGESMKDAGILEGDFVVVRPSDTARNGEIVVALLGDEATVKRYFKEKDHVRLQPENKSMKPLRSRDIQVLGHVVGVFRRVS